MQILQHLANLKSSSSKVSGPLFANLLCQSQTYVIGSTHQSYQFFGVVTSPEFAILQRTASTG